MKNLFFVLTFLSGIFIQQLSAQIPEWEWASKTGGAQGRLITSDKSENVYMSGKTNVGTTYFDGHPCTCNGGSNGCGYIAKYDSAGNFIWFRSENTPDSADCLFTAISTDPFGNIYLGGTFLNTIYFDSDTLSSSTFAAFITKFDSSGNVVWSKMISQTGFLNIHGLTTDYEGKIYITGSFQDSVPLGPDTLHCAGIGDSYIAKFDSSGDVIWARSAGGSDLDWSESVVTDAALDVYQTGDFVSPTMTFDSFVLSNPGAGRVPYLAKYDSIGNFKWVVIGSVNIYNNGSVDLAIDSLANIYWAGYFYASTISFGNITLNNSGGGSNAFIVKYDSSGNALWVNSVRGIGNGNIGCRNICADTHGRIYMTGFYGGGFDIPSVVIGSFIFPFPGDPFANPMFIAGYDYNGNVLFGKALESGGSGNDVTAGPSGCAYIGADYYSSNPYFIIGNDSFAGNSSSPFIAKLFYPNTTTGISNNINNQDDIALYPNPFDTYFQILASNNKLYEAKLFDLTSRELIRENFTNSMSIDTKFFAKGIYILEIKYPDGKLFTKKIIKQ